MLRLEEVSKRYGRGRWVLREVSLDVSPSEVVAITGRNGSGKSTLLRLAVGISRPTRGRVASRACITGYVPERFPPDERMPALAYLTHVGRIRGLSTASAARQASLLLDRLNLAGGRDVPLRTLSKGNAQKVAVAQAVLVPPDLLVLDEPWSGLDAAIHEVLGALIGEVSDSGTAVLFTDHREAVTSAYASRTLTVDDGRVAEGLAGRVRSGYVTVRLAGSGSAIPSAAEWTALDGVREAVVDDAGITIRVRRASVDALLLHALGAGWSVVAVTPAGGAG